MRKEEQTSQFFFLCSCYCGSSTVDYFLSAPCEIAYKDGENLLHARRENLSWLKYA